MNGCKERKLGVAGENAYMRSNRLGVMISLFLIVATALVFWQVTEHDFINYDDDVYVTENPHVNRGFTTQGFIGSFTRFHGSNWHPLTWLSHMLDSHLFGLKSGFHHLTNLLFHVINTLLLFFLLRRMTSATWCSAFVAALFALHPLHVESVAWIAERKDVLSTLFWMLTLWAYVRYCERVTVFRYFLILIFFTLGLMAKPTLVTLPFVLFLLDYWPLGRLQLAHSIEDRNREYQRTTIFHLVWEKVPLLALSVVSCIVTFLAQQKGGAVTSLDVLPVKVRIANALVSYVGYVGKMIWPHDLAVFYPHPETIPMWQAAGSGLLLLCLSFVFFMAIRSHPYLVVGWLWYLGTLIPMVGLVQVGDHSVADRYTYIPLIGLFIMISWGIPDLMSKWRYRRNVLSISAGLTLLALALCTWFQLRHWKDSVTLFEHTVNVTTDNYLAHNNLGIGFVQQGKYDEAIEHYQEALRIKPEWAQARYNLGVARTRQGKFDEAIQDSLKALQKDPNLARARLNLANALLSRGQIQAAIENYQEAIRIKPDYARAHSNLGVVFMRQGRIDDAISHLKKALRINPDDERIRFNLDLALKQKYLRKLK